MTNKARKVSIDERVQKANEMQLLTKSSSLQFTHTKLTLYFSVWE